jgi:hypothetical protein
VTRDPDVARWHYAHVFKTNISNDGKDQSRVGAELSGDEIENGDRKFKIHIILTSAINKFLYRELEI